MGLNSFDGHSIFLKESDFGAIIGKYPKFNEWYGHKGQDWNLTMFIMHEFGHCFAVNYNPDYRSWHTVYKENWGYWFMNTRYNNRFGKEPEDYKSPIWFTIRRIFGLTNGRNP